MNTVKKNSILTAVALVFLSVGCLVSCKQTPQNNADVAELQTRLDDIMKEYQELQSTCDGYATQHCCVSNNGWTDALHGL